MKGDLLGIPRAGLFAAEHVQEAVASTLSRLAVSDVHPHHVRGGEGASDVPFRFGDDNVHLGCEHAAQSHRDTQADGEGRGDDLVVGAKIDGYEGQPDDARGVHRKGNVFGLVEVGRDVACLEGIVGAAHDEQAVVAQWCHHAYVAGITDEVDLTYARVGLDGLRRLQNDECDLQSQLHADQHEGDDHLGPGAHETRLPGADLLLASCQDASDAVGFGHQGGVAHGGRQAHKEPLQVAGDHCGACN